MEIYYEEVPSIGKEENELLEKAKVVAYNAIDLFFEKLGLNPELYSELHNIDVTVGEVRALDGKRGDSQYEASLDLITIDKDHLQEMLDIIKAASKEEMEKTEKNVILNVAQSIIHETIHAARRIHTPENIIPMDDWGTIVRNRHIQEEGDKANYVVPCDVILQEHSDIKDERELLKLLEQQECLEEAITDALAQMVIYNTLSKYQNSSIRQLAEKVSCDDNDFVASGSKIVDAMGTDLVARFITTRFSDEPYQDLFYEMFDTDYYILLSDIDEIDAATRKGDFPSKSITQEFDKILSNHRQESSIDYKII